MASLMCSMCYLRTWLPATLLPYSPVCQLHWAPWPCSLASALWLPVVMLPTVVGPKSPAAGWEGANSFERQSFILFVPAPQILQQSPQVPECMAGQGLAPSLLCLLQRKQKALGSWWGSCCFLWPNLLLGLWKLNMQCFPALWRGWQGLCPFIVTISILFLSKTLLWALHRGLQYKSS